MPKYIFVTGGVVSSLGKGITAASLGRLLKSRGLKVTLQKFDPYLNVDPGMMSPYQHGEVYVTDDGAETDLDLGHYERIVDIDLTQYSSITSGKIYWSVLNKERRGDYHGGTVQVIPHVTNEIKRMLKRIATVEDVDIVITEIGGTVGDIESQPFLEAIRQIRYEVGRDNVLYIHVTLLPYLSMAGELKTKPTQHSVKELLSIGIQPDILVCRSEKEIPEELKAKIALFCNVSERYVISAVDISHSIYEIPYMLHENQYDEVVLEHFGLPVKPLHIPAWDTFFTSLMNPKKKVTIAVVGKYISLQDSYRSIYEALIHGAVANNAELEILRIESEEIERKYMNSLEELFKNVNGILIPGGFGNRGIEGKIATIEYARTHKIPLFGICLGLQCAVIEFARHGCGMENANSTEFDPTTPYPVISLLEEQELIDKLGGTMRLGAYLCVFEDNTRIKSIYNTDSVMERHRHRFEFTLKYKQLFEKHGMIFSGFNPQSNLVETIEYADHPWFICTQFHPEFKSKPVKPHPLFKDFIRASMENIC